MESAAAMSGRARTWSAAASASASTAVDGCVPLISASPSFAPSVIGFQARALQRLAAGNGTQRPRSPQRINIVFASFALIVVVVVDEHFALRR